MTSRPTLLIADDHPIVATALAESLGRSYDVVGVVTDLDELESTLSVKRPNLLLLDLSFGSRSSLPLIHRLVECSAASKILVLTAYNEPILAEAAIKAGASGFVMKASDTSELHNAIPAVLAGHVFVSVEPGPVAAPRTLPVTRKDKRILTSLVKGATQAEAAQLVDLTRQGAEYRLTRLRRALGFSRTEQLLRWFSRTHNT